MNIGKIRSDFCLGAKWYTFWQPKRQFLKENKAKVGLAAALVASCFFPYYAGPVAFGFGLYNFLIQPYKNDNDKDYRISGLKRACFLSVGMTLLAAFPISHMTYAYNSTIHVTQESQDLVVKAAQETLRGYVSQGQAPASVTILNKKTGLYFKLGDENWSDSRINIIGNSDGSFKACGSLEIFTPPTPQALAKGYSFGNRRVLKGTICSDGDLTL